MGNFDVEKTIVVPDSGGTGNNFLAGMLASACQSKGLDANAVMALTFLFRYRLLRMAHVVRLVAMVILGVTDITAVIMVVGVNRKGGNYVISY